MRRRHNNELLFNIIVFGVIALVIATVYFVGRIRRRKRTEALTLVADDLGLSFTPEGNEDFVHSFSWCELSARGRGKKALNLMRGASDGREVAIFDYEFVTGNGKSRKVWRSTVACLRFDGPELPGFSLRPEATWDKISKWFGSADIDFDTHPQFSRSFLLRSDNEPAVRALFTRDVLDFYEQHQGFSTEGSGHTLVVYRLGKQIPPTDIKPFLADAFEALSLFQAGSET